MEENVNEVKLENVEQFSLENTGTVPTEEEVVVEIDPIEDIINYDFSSNEEFNFDENYGHLQELKSSSEEAKQLEAENVIKDLCPKYMNEQEVLEIEKLKKNMEAFLRKYNVEGEYMKAIPSTPDGEKLKTKIFAIGQLLYNNFHSRINNISFNILWTRDEYKLINYAFTDKGEHDGQSVYNIYELKTTYLDAWKDTERKLDRSTTSFLINIDIKNMVMFYHYINKHVVKGLGKDFETFKSILDKIVDTHKIFNAFGVIKERLGVDFNFWVGALTPDNQPESIPGNAINPVPQVQ